MAHRNFQKRHIGPSEEDIQVMLETIGVDSIDELVRKTVPEDIFLEGELDIDPAMTEHEYIMHLKEIAEKNKIFKNYIGLGYSETIVPAAIQRNILENPGWYTAYTPYQSEISQGRLEALINFQTTVSELTGMELANASLLDEATAAAEAMSMLFSSRPRQAVKENVNRFFVSKNCFPQTIAVLETRATPLGIDLMIGDPDEIELDETFFGALLQYPAIDGEITDYKEFTKKAKEKGIRIAVASDLMALILLTPPGEWGADVVVGNSQRFGVPMGFGGPHAAFFATREEFKRNIPGRIIGVSIDRDGKPAFRMALQTREQHIRRDKATSNICTAQALLAVMAGMYAVYHGAEGLKKIAGDIAQKTDYLAKTIEKLDFELVNNSFFDTIELKPPSSVSVVEIRNLAEENNINLRYTDQNTIGISIGEAISSVHLTELVNIFRTAVEEEPIDEIDPEIIKQNGTGIPNNLKRTSDFLDHEVFHRYHSETELMRYAKKLENRDFSLTHGMIPLGSCTMKLNAATELIPITWPEFAHIHPFAPEYQTRGYRQIIEELDRDLSEITGFARVSMQPNSGAQGEFAGLMVIQAYHMSRNEGHRNVVLIPSSAHGTNPASAVMAGMKVVVVKCDQHGNIDVDDLAAKAEKHSDNLSSLMVTYPSTHGVFEPEIRKITSIVHEHGGQVYMDGANMNAQVGLTNPGQIGADVCHLNLHKTFAIPHGGGGPGMGPIGVAEHLAPFLPGNPVVKTGGNQGISAISAAPWGSALILLISYGYIKMLGTKGLTKSTEIAMLNANYLKARLKNNYSVLYQGINDTVAHEMILDCREFKKTAKIEVEDIAKRLIDYGFHAPTVSFPVNGTLMVEPTESESKYELDRFVEAMLSIREEIEKIENATWSEDNPLKNAPHPAHKAINSSWVHAYSREEAVYPVEELRFNKFWPPVSRVDNAYGDRNLMCTCPDTSVFAEG